MHSGDEVSELKDLATCCSQVLSLSASPLPSLRPSRRTPLAVRAMELEAFARAQGFGNPRPKSPQKALRKAKRREFRGASAVPQAPMAHCKER